MMSVVPPVRSVAGLNADAIVRQRTRNNGGPNSGATASLLAENELSSGGHPLTTSGRHLNFFGDLLIS